MHKCQLVPGPIRQGKIAQNSYKHGLTGEGVVISVEDAAEIERRSLAFEEELRPSGEISDALVRRAAFLSVRLDRAMMLDTIAVDDRVTKAKAECVVPEGTARRKRRGCGPNAGRRAMFDHSKEENLAHSTRPPPNAACTEP